MQLSLFENQEIEEKLNAMPKKMSWMPSFWNENTWYYQDEIGYSMSDDYGRTKHIGTMLPILITKK